MYKHHIVEELSTPALLAALDALEGEWEVIGFHRGGTVGLAMHNTFTYSVLLRQPVVVEAPF